MKRSEDLARAGRRARPTARGSPARSVHPADPPRPRCRPHILALAPAEKRLVVEMGETAQRLARRYPGQAETMIRGSAPRASPPSEFRR